MMDFLKIIGLMTKLKVSKFALYMNAIFCFLIQYPCQAFLIKSQLPYILHIDPSSSNNILDHLIK